MIILKRTIIGIHQEVIIIFDGKELFSNQKRYFVFFLTKMLFILSLVVVVVVVVVC